MRLMRRRPAGLEPLKCSTSWKGRCAMGHNTKGWDAWDSHQYRSFLGSITPTIAMSTAQPCNVLAQDIPHHILPQEILSCTEKGNQKHQSADKVTSNRNQKHQSADKVTSNRPERLRFGQRRMNVLIKYSRLG